MIIHTDRIIASSDINKSRRDLGYKKHEVIYEVAEWVKNMTGEVEGRTNFFRSERKAAEDYNYVNSLGVRVSSATIRVISIKEGFDRRKVACCAQHEDDAYVAEKILIADARSKINYDMIPIDNKTFLRYYMEDVWKDKETRSGKAESW